MSIFKETLTEFRKKAEPHVRAMRKRLGLSVKETKEERRRRLSYQMHHRPLSEIAEVSAEELKRKLNLDQ